jgi:ectoine hydroxylase-related dioxygenase (phytanoyl-CoA dioxygenase family)
MIEPKVGKVFDQDYLVGRDDISSFQRNGHVLLKNVLDPAEAELQRSVITRAAYQYNQEHRKLEDRDTYGKAFLQITNLWEVDENVRPFTMARRFAKIAAQLLQVDRVRLYHDQALFKEPGGGHTPWHQDQFYWPLDTKKTITMWMPLIAIDEEMGMLTFASGSHTSGLYANVEISDQSEAAINRFVKEKEYPIARPTFMEAGDATWHSGWVMHAAPGNHSAKTREVMTIIYFADGARVAESMNEFQETDRNRWLKGIAAGLPAASDLNPVLC